MSSLTAHLRRPDDHARLAFHSECPLCRGERLSRALPADAFLGRRSQALLAASVLALSSAAPTAALATEPDEEQEGTAAPQVAPQDAWADPSTDVGGESTELPSIETAAPVDEATIEPDDDSAEVELEPPIDDAVPVEAPDPLAAEPVQQPPPADPPPAPAADPPPVPPIAVPQPSVPDPVMPTADQRQGDGRSPSRARDRERARPRHDAVAPPSATPAAPAPLPEPNEAATANSPVTVHVTQGVREAGESVSSGGPRRGQRSHVVRHGESLWSIARDFLGEDATSAARIAREVNRLWELNSARIRTGDPDLLLVGTRIVLR